MGVVAPPAFACLLVAALLDDALALLDDASSSFENNKS